MKPWIEKYRPSSMENIVLDEEYKIIFNSIVDHLCFPHLIFYGPPGSGKTTTILCLLKKICEQYNMKHNSIHLNASDERGIDVIRNTIYSFVKSEGIFTNSCHKFVILDEIDSMTKIAQQSLLTLLDYKNVHFCLICNYISKLIPNIRNKCLMMNFHNIQNYRSYMDDIIQQENINIEETIIEDIIYNHYPDIRCMVNSLQCYKYIKMPLIKEKYMIKLSEKYNHNYLKKNLELFDKKEFLYKLFMYMVEHYKIDTILIEYMKNIIFYDLSLDYISNVYIPYFYSLQN